MTSEVFQVAISGALVFVKSKGLFMQDGATCHTSKSTLEYLSTKGVPVLTPWPANSPDLNPVENMWSIVAREVEKAMPIATKDELWGVVLAAWDTVPQQQVDKLVKSFPHRVKTLLAKKKA